MGVWRIADSRSDRVCELSVSSCDMSRADATVKERSPRKTTTKELQRGEHRSEDITPFMAKPDDSTANREPDTPWGTSEELLLACAVSRYGTDSWDSVAIEIQKRTSSSSLHHLLTPTNCKRKYDALRRRFTAKDDDDDDVSEPDDDDDDDDKSGTMPWVDELRKLRVAELKREVERYDLSIVSLQLKVNRLKEEREQSLGEYEKGGGKSDLEKSVERESEGEEKREGDAEPKKLSSGSAAEMPVSGEESDRDNQSVNESNSTDPKRENLETGLEKGREADPDRTGEEESDRTSGRRKAVREDSCNGSSDSIRKEPATEPVKVEPDAGPGDSPELLESVAESKGGGGGEERTKESSDVQSSASLSRLKGRNKVVAVASRGGEEPENENQSTRVKVVSAKSQPLIDFLEIVRSHKLGSCFERRLESQETPKYRNLIRQHVDLETIRTRLEEGWYVRSKRKFFRDLLLIVNNAIVFFGERSSESTAAIELRQLVLNEMARRNPKSELSGEQQTSLPPVPLPPKLDPEPSKPSLLKPKISGPIIVCRKRSSITAKASGSSSGVDKKREQTASSAEEKPIQEPKQSDKSSGNAEEHRITKKRSRDRFASGSRNVKKNSENRTNTITKKNSEATPSQNKSKGGSNDDRSEPKNEKKSNTATVAVNKQGAANFLNRMKRSSSSNNGPIDTPPRSSTVNSDNHKGGGSEPKKSGNGKGDGRKESKDQAPRRSSGGRQVKEQGSPAKRSVGRPPKRAAAPSPSQPPVSGKRSREGGENDAAASRQQKKRSRK